MGAKISILPIIHAHRKDKAGNVPLAIRIDLNGRTAAYDKIGYGYKIPFEAWDQAERCIKHNHPLAKLLNAKILKRTSELSIMFLQQDIAGKTLNKAAIKSLIQGIDPSYDFYGFCGVQVQEKYNNKETLRTYNSEITKLKQFKPSLQFSDITFPFLQSYQAWMRDERGNAPNTVWKSFKFLNTMLNDAINIGGYIETNPFDRFDRGKYRQSERDYLTKKDREALEELLNHPLPDNIYHATVYFLFICYTGLRYQDVLNFDYDTHIIDDERLVIITHKAKEPLNLKIFPKLRNILRYVQNRKIGITNQEFNRLLKVVGNLAGLKFPLSAHKGRHSFGRLLAESGIDISKAQKMLAHRDKKSTAIYYHLINKDIDDEVDNKLGSL